MKKISILFSLLTLVLTIAFVGCLGGGYYYSLTITPGANGTVTATTPLPAGKTKYRNGTVVQLNVQAADGYALDGWTGTNGTEVTADNTILINEDKVIQPVFALGDKLTVNISPEGTGTVTKSPASANDRYTTGSEVTLIPAPASGYTFVRWEGTNFNDVNLGRIIMNGPKEITAVFKPGITKYRLDIAVSNGSYTLSPEQPANGYEPGTQVTITPIPAESYKFTRYTGASKDDVSNNIITMDGTKVLGIEFLSAADGKIKQYATPYDITDMHGLTCDSYVDNGILYMAYKKTDINKVYVKKWNGTSWSDDVGDTTAMAQADKVNLYVYQGTPYICFGYGSGSVFKIEKIVNGNSVSVVSGTAPGKISRSKGFVVTGENKLYVLRKDENNKLQLSKFENNTWTNYEIDSAPEDYIMEKSGNTIYILYTKDFVGDAELGYGKLKAASFDINTSTVTHDLGGDTIEAKVFNWIGFDISIVKNIPYITYVATNTTPYKLYCKKLEGNTWVGAYDDGIILTKALKPGPFSIAIGYQGDIIHTTYSLDGSGTGFNNRLSSEGWKSPILISEMMLTPKIHSSADQVIFSFIEFGPSVYFKTVTLE